ncbi:hypothetical protein [Virgibacillus halodenitrificans]|uniref:hypothetical protein n=1 Tax=Virgibacillus halodenitrificans TaxID=1482 RepID=UPI000EF4EDBB|nr:hypothetical protein [Virgibacillus halodenitrificans]
MDNLYVSMNCNFDKERQYLSIDVIPQKQSDNEKIGTGEVYVLAQRWFDWDPYGYLLVADSISGNSSNIVDVAVNDSDFQIDIMESIAIVTEIKIYKEFRNKGYGSDLIRQLKDYLFDVLRVSAILLMAEPIDEELKDAEVEHNREKLINQFYKRNGFLSYQDNFLAITRKGYMIENGKLNPMD